MNIDPGKLNLDVSIRRLVLADLPDVLEIEKRSFPVPWSAAMFTIELSKSSSVCLRAELQGRLVGYLVASRYDIVWHIMNVSVDPGHRRAGIGGLLLENAFALTESGPTHYTLEVRPSNVAAIAMYRRHGFESAGLRPGYYADNNEDAVIMWRSTDPAFTAPNADQK